MRHVGGANDEVTNAPVSLVEFLAVAVPIDLIVSIRAEASTPYQSEVYHHSFWYRALAETEKSQYILAL